jgi:hypothetical protein
MTMKREARLVFGFQLNWLQEACESAFKKRQWKTVAKKARDCRRPM